MPKLNESDRKARRDLILDAAYRCFARKGFGRTTMRDIAREAGLSLGGVYVHFASKDALMSALAELGRETTKARLASSPPRREATAAGILDSLLRELGDERCLESVRLDLRLWGEALHTPALKRHVERAFESAREPLEDAVRRAQKEGELPRTVSAETGARVLLGIFIGLAVQKVIDPDTDIDASAAFVRSVLSRSRGRR